MNTDSEEEMNIDQNYDYDQNLSITLSHISIISDKTSTDLEEIPLAVQPSLKNQQI
jgi:hypothetical protein